ncbi:MAG: hypothetical protein H7Y41_05035, partial [Hyphomonadaceae bacterium]|nr:hypothetical protein [Clostridia bacterium]
GSASAISKDDKLYTWSGANYKQGGNGPLYARYNVKSASYNTVIALDNKAYKMMDFLVDTKDILIREDVEYYSGMNYIDVNGVLYYAKGLRKDIDGDIITEDVKKVIGSTGIIFLKNDNSAWILRNKNQTDYAYQDYPLTPTKISDDCIDVAMCVERVAFVKTDGTVWAFGKPYIRGSQNETLFALQAIEPTQIADGDFVEVACGYNFFAAKKSDNSLWVWGANDKYQLGREGEGTLLPEKILDDVISFSCSGEIGLAVKADGTLWAWGDSGVAYGLSEDEGRDKSNKAPRQLFAHKVKTEIKRNAAIYNMSSALAYEKP